MKQAFIEKKFIASSIETINLINAILDEYKAQGFKLSLRQLYYQLVARGYINNNQRSYKNTGNLVSEARQAGLIDWEMIEDRNRGTESLQHWESPAEIMRAAARSFHIDKWENQPWHIEVMVEKDALSGVLMPVCRSLDVSITANKGYSSSSTMYDIGRRLNWYHYHGQKNIRIIYLGDHDPSGIDMTRDVKERILMYSEIIPNPFRLFEVERLALNYDQVEMWNPPENPAKETDARYSGYVDQFGASSWELDAVEPATLADLVRQAVVSRRDQDLWSLSVGEENRMRAELNRFADNYENGDYDEDVEEDGEE